MEIFARLVVASETDLYLAKMMIFKDVDQFLCISLWQRVEEHERCCMEKQRDGNWG